MISGFEIVNQNNEDVLFLNLDFSYELVGVKKEKLFPSIKKFLKYIDFKGKKIFLVSSGIITVTLLIDPLKLDTLSNTASYNYVTKIIIHDFNNDNLKNYEININDYNSYKKGNILEKQQENDVNKKTIVNKSKSNVINNSNESIKNKINLVKQLLQLMDIDAK